MYSRQPEPQRRKHEAHVEREGRRKAAERKAREPKRPRSAYHLFCEGYRRSRSVDIAALPMAEVARRCGAAWREVSEADREEYDEAAKDDLKRYVRECEEVGIDPGKAALMARGPPPALTATQILQARCEAVMGVSLSSNEESALAPEVVAILRQGRNEMSYEEVSSSHAAKHGSTDRQRSATQQPSTAAKHSSTHTQRSETHSHLRTFLSTHTHTQDDLINDLVTMDNERYEEDLADWQRHVKRQKRDGREGNNNDDGLAVRREEAYPVSVEGSRGVATPASKKKQSGGGGGGTIFGSAVKSKGSAVKRKKKEAAASTPGSAVKQSTQAAASPGSAVRKGKAPSSSSPKVRVIRLKVNGMVEELGGSAAAAKASLFDDAAAASSSYQGAGKSPALPPGWTAVKHDAKSCSYNVFHAPDGKTKVRSVKDAWKKHEEMGGGA